MLKSATINILLLACASNATAWAQTAAMTAQAAPSVRNTIQQAASTSEPSYETAYNFAKALRSKEMLLVESRYSFDGGLAKDLQSDSEIASMEADYPGITQYLMLELRSEVEKQVTDSLPALWDSLARLFVKTMNERQLAEALAYYSSDSGKRLIVATLENANYSRLTKAMIDNPEGNITGNDLSNSMRAGVGKTVSAMSAEDQSALLAFSKTEAYGKVRELGPKVQAVSAEWANESSPENEQRIEKIAGQAVEAFIEKAEANNHGK